MAGKLFQEVAVAVDQAHGPIVQFQSAGLGVDQAHITRSEIGKFLHQFLVGLEPALGQGQPLAHIADHLVDGGQQLVALLGRERPVDPTGHGKLGVDAPPAGQGGDELLAVLAQLDGL